MRFPDKLVQRVDKFKRVLSSTDLNEMAVRCKLDTGGWPYRLLDIAQSSTHAPHEAVAPILTSILTAVYFATIPHRPASKEAVKRSIVTHKF